MIICWPSIGDGHDHGQKTLRMVTQGRSALQLILVSHPTVAAEDLARGLVEEGLAACVNILPGARSIYRWEGKTCDEQEVMLFIKSAIDPIERLIEIIAERHPFECPEVIVVPVVTGLGRYLRWVEEMCTGQEPN